MTKIALIPKEPSAEAHVGKAGKVFYYFTEAALDAWLCPMGKQS